MTSQTDLPPTTLADLNRHIQQRFQDLTPQFQVGARYLLDYPAEIPIASMRQVATQAGVQPATLVRLAQTLGYPGWAELKQVFVQSLHSAPRHYADRAQTMMRGGGVKDIYTRTLNTQADNMRLLGELPTGQIDDVATHIARGRHVYIGGFRASFAAAYTFYYLYRLFRPSVTLLRSDAGTLEMDLDLISRHDTVVIISFAPYSHESMRVLEASRQAGAHVVALSDSMVAPLVLGADSTLLFSTETPSFFPSVTAAVTLSEILVEALLARSGEQALADLRRRENRLHTTGAYLTPKS